VPERRGADARQTDSTSASPAAKKYKEKRKAVECKKNQVPVKVNRRTVGCRSPRRRAGRRRTRGDPRLALANALLADDFGGLARSPRPQAAVVEEAVPQGQPARLGCRAERDPAGSRQARPARGGRRRTPTCARLRRSMAAARLDRRIPDCARTDVPLPTKSETFSSSGAGEKADHHRDARQRVDARPRARERCLPGRHQDHHRRVQSVRRPRLPDRRRRHRRLRQHELQDLAVDRPRPGEVLVSQSFSYTGQNADARPRSTRTRSSTSSTSSTSRRRTSPSAAARSSSAR